MSAVPPNGAGNRYLNIAGALEQIGDEGALREMLLMVQDSLMRDVPAISEMLNKGDVQGANHLLHPLKGYVPIFCTAELVAQVSEVEFMSKKEDAPTVAVAYAALAPELRVLEAEVAAYLGIPA